jgi:hypothetical protein
MSDDLTPERAREMLCDAQYEPQPECAWQMADNAGRAILAAWERDRAELDALRERLAEVTKQRDALVPYLANVVLDSSEGRFMGYSAEWLAPAVAILAAIRAEREGQRDG